MIERTPQATLSPNWRKPDYMNDRDAIRAAQAKRLRKLLNYTNTPLAQARRFRQEQAADLPPYVPMQFPEPIEIYE